MFAGAVVAGLLLEEISESVAENCPILQRVAEVL
jgi:hypothetical protein